MIIIMAGMLEMPQNSDYLIKCKVCPRTGHDGPEWELSYSSALYPRR
jgi:hypothetical protein